MDDSQGALIREAYEQSGEIAPKLLRRFGITEGNRQTLLLGMFVSQLVNPYKYTIYPGFYESCGPEGEKLIEYVEKEWKKEPHVGELPLDVVADCARRGDAAVAAIDQLQGKAKENADEFSRLANDMHCYREFAWFFYYKVHAAKHVLDYQWSRDLACLDSVAPLLEKSIKHYQKLVDLTKEHYLYANSMQTAQRRIPIGGDEGRNKTWEELLPHYEKELANFRAHLQTLKDKAAGKVSDTDADIEPMHVADVRMLTSRLRPVRLTEGAVLMTNLPANKVQALAPELRGMTAYAVDGAAQRENGTELEFECKAPVKLLVGYFKDDQKKYAKTPTLETDASANEYGQAEPLLTNAIHLEEMPLANVHAYSFPAGRHTLRLPTGMALVLGFTDSEVKVRNAALDGTDDVMDWLFY